MRSINTLIILLTTVCTFIPVGFALSEKASENLNFSRYKVICEKRPFIEIRMSGSKPDDESRNKKDEAKVISLSMVAFTRIRGLIRVGLVDGKNNVYRLKVGESIDGIKLIEADIENKTSVIMVGEEQMLLSMRSRVDRVGISHAGSKVGMAEKERLEEKRIKVTQKQIKNYLQEYTRRRKEGAVFLNPLSVVGKRLRQQKV